MDGNRTPVDAAAVSTVSWAQVEPLLDAALDLPESERARYLDTACAGDAALRAAVERLLVRTAAPHAQLDRWAGSVFPTLLDELDSPAPALPALLASRYRIEREIGRGGMAVVYLAHDQRLDRPVAIKLLRPETATRLGARRFSAEIKLTANLRHPNIVPLFDSGEADGWFFFVMPFIEGTSLRARIAGEVQLPLDDVLQIVDEVAAALDYAHECGVLHRDLKPENIMLSGDRAFVLDFGIARALEPVADERITMAGVTVGTPHYMSPEQATADPHVDRRSDVYALACVAYEMLTGAPPFTGASAQAVRARQLLETPGHVHVVRPGLPEWVDRALQTGLAKSPADRQATCGALARQMRESTVPATPPSSRWLWGSIAALAVLVLAGAVYSFIRTPPAPTAPSWLLVSHVQASQQEGELGAAIEELLRSEFSRSPNLAVVSSDQVRRALRAAELPDTTTLTSQRAREVALRSNVKVFVSGTVHRLAADRISLTVSLVDADSGLVVASRAATFGLGDDELLPAIARVTRELRAELGDRSLSSGPGEQHAFVSTPSFAAFKLYSDALSANRRGNLDGSTHLLQQAVALDTAFAAAWSVLAENYVTLRQPDSARLAFARALAHPERLSAPEADRIRGDKAFQTEYDPEDAVRWYRRYLERVPLSTSGWNDLALSMSALGLHEEALEALERTFAIDPFELGPRPIELLNYAAELVVVGKRDSARRVSARLSGPDAEYMHLLLLNASDQWDSLAVLGERLADAPETEEYVRVSANLHAIGARAALGDTARAVARLARISGRAHGGTQRLYVHARLLFDLTRGVRPAWSLPASLIADSSVGGRFVRAVHAAQRGDQRGAERERAALVAHGALAVRSLGAGLPYLEYLMAQGADTLAAGGQIIALAAAGEHDPLSVDRPSTIALRWLAEQVLSATGRTAEADSLRTVARSPIGLPPQHYPLRGLVMRATSRAMSRQ